MRVRVRADYERDIEFLDAGADAGACSVCGRCGSDCGERSNDLFPLRVRVEYELALMRSPEYRVQLL